jgi:hypothetical protein
MFIAVIAGSQESMWNWETFIVPLAPGQVFPKLPPQGVTSRADAAALPGAKSMENFVLPGETAGIYAFSRITVHRNLFRIPLP